MESFLFIMAIIILSMLYDKYIKKDDSKKNRYDDYDIYEDNDDDYNDYYNDSEDYEEEEEENYEDTDYKKEYKQYIGEKFEEKGDFVIYSFLENAHKSVDMITLSCSSKYINFIKCKYWKNKSITESRLEKVYQKLNDYALYRQSTDSEELVDLLKMELLYECGVKSTAEIKKLFSIRKILYIAKGKTINLEENKNIIKIKDNIFRYKDMKIVFTKDR